MPENDTQTQTKEEVTDEKNYEEPDTEEVEADEESDEPPRFKGRYISRVGRRKSAVARVRLYKKGSGVIQVNGKKLSEYFESDKASVVRHPLKLTSLQKDFNFSVVVKGGGSNGQAEAIRHGIARALVEYDEGLKPSLKAKGWLSRDDRTKERKKPGLKKARRRPQWSKR